MTTTITPPRRVMPHLYRWLLRCYAVPFASAAIWTRVGLIAYADRIIYAAAAALLIAASRNPSRRIRWAAAFTTAVAGSWRAAILIDLQIIGDTAGQPAVGALAWIALTVTAVLLAAYGWLHRGPGPMVEGKASR